MPLIDTNHQRAALLVLLLGLALVIALTPYATGLLGIPVLYAVFAPLHDWLGMRVRPRLAASLVVALALFLIVVPGVSFAGLIVGQAQEIASGVIRNPLLGRLRELPVVGSGLVWGPGAIALMIGNHALAGMLLALGGVVIVGNVDYVIRPRVFSRWANIHPLVTLIGALAGVPYFGILGLLIGPLALSYFFELIKMYGDEYLG